MSHINYSSNTSESDLNEISFSLIDSNEEQEISYEEVEELKNELIFETERRRELLKNTQTVVTTSGSLCSLSLSTTTMAITSSSLPPPLPPMSSFSPQKQFPLSSSQLTSYSETNRKCLATTKHDRRMAKQMTERKRRDRINALLDNLRTLILKLLHKNVSSDLLLISVSSSSTTIFNLCLLNQLVISYNMFTFNDIRY
ncbi:unnamed protein product [Schistosoma mattheei]|uniref:Uncharacterized protein n=1 Tax=Schistosoma mattheei TaxID=31246 RepID=A0A183PAE3_9TREM|nr:unnamed protein product [Schistosoma mattheei]